MKKIKIFTIGFTKQSAESFFGKLQSAGVKRVMDVRLNNISQLAGFAKKDDLAYFLNSICGIDYVHLLEELAPTKEILDEYRRRKKSGWPDYKRKYVELITYRRVEEKLSREMFDRGCLLCSEDVPDYCHRRLAAEYLKRKWGGIEIEHIL